MSSLEGRAMPLHDWTDERGWDSIHPLWLTSRPARAWSCRRAGNALSTEVCRTSRCPRAAFATLALNWRTSMPRLTFPALLLTALLIGIPPVWAGQDPPKAVPATLSLDVIIKGLEKAEK